MDWLLASIAETDASGLMDRLREPLLLLPVIMAVGMAIGAIRIAGLSLGASGVLFAALLFGHLGRDAGWELPGIIGQVGLVLFVYAVGLSAGPTFLRTFRDQGKNLALLAVVAAGVGGVAAAVLAGLLGIPSDFAAGLFTGAMTSTPGWPPVSKRQSRPARTRSRFRSATAWPIRSVSSARCCSSSSCRGCCVSTSTRWDAS